jgi:tRNA(His) 5'-end guanylyltransferase
LAGEASATFSLLLGRRAAFDCRVSQLPSADLVVDYFRWRSEDAARNCLNAYCYWTQRKLGADAPAATARLSGMSTAQKNEFLFERGVNFNDVPAWQKRGVGLYWEEFDQVGRNPATGEESVGRRRRIRRDLELPMKETYEKFVERFAGSLEASAPESKNAPGDEP